MSSPYEHSSTPNPGGYRGGEDGTWKFDGGRGRGNRNVHADCSYAKRHASDEDDKDVCIIVHPPTPTLQQSDGGR